MCIILIEFLAGINYERLINSRLIFDSAKAEHIVNIPIFNMTDETNLEVDEEFIVSLSCPESGEPVRENSVILAPNNATVAIHELNGESRIL